MTAQKQSTSAAEVTRLINDPNYGLELYAKDAAKKTHTMWKHLKEFWTDTVIPFWDGTNNFQKICMQVAAFVFPIGIIILLFNLLIGTFDVLSTAFWYQAIYPMTRYVHRESFDLLIYSSFFDFDNARVAAMFLTGCFLLLVTASILHFLRNLLDVTLVFGAYYSFYMQHPEVLNPSYCKNCQKRLSADANFCSECGFPTAHASNRPHVIYVPARLSTSDAAYLLATNKPSICPSCANDTSHVWVDTDNNRTVCNHCATWLVVLLKAHS